MQIERRAVCTECNEAAPRVRKGKKFKLCEDCRRAVTTKKWRVRAVKRTLSGETGRPVEFNTGEGWRVGYFIKFGEYSDARIQPVGAMGKIPDIIGVSLADVKKASCGSPSMPTVEDFYRKMGAMQPKKIAVLVAQPYPPMSALVKEILDGAVVRRPANSIVSENELAGPEVGDVSFPFGDNIESPTTCAGHAAAASPNDAKPKSKRAVTPKQDAITVGLKYGPWKALEYTGHSRWKCVSDSGEEKVLYSAELRTAAAAK
ncbi:MAG: hypothetical protein ACHQU0_03250 [Candidatus Paceibacteria bacterium]